MYITSLTLVGVSSIVDDRHRYRKLATPRLQQVLVVIHGFVVGAKCESPRDTTSPVRTVPVWVLLQVEFVERRSVGVRALLVELGHLLAGAVEALAACQPPTRKPGTARSRLAAEKRADASSPRGSSSPSCGDAPCASGSSLHSRPDQ